jgi:hypothetical protein
MASCDIFASIATCNTPKFYSTTWAPTSASRRQQITPRRLKSHASMTVSEVWPPSAYVRFAKMHSIDGDKNSCNIELEPQR